MYLIKYKFITLFLNKKIFLIIFFFLINFIVFSQVNEEGLPLIQNIFPKDYGYESYNNSIIQSSKGITYIGNRDGILEYDGSFWRLIKFKGLPHLAIDNDKKIYVAGFGDFGYLSPDKKNQMAFSSLLKEKNKIKSFGFVHDLVTFNDLVFFCSYNKLYKWDNSSLEIIDSSKTNYRLFKVNFNNQDEIYFYNDEKGLLKYNKGNIELVNNGDFFKSKEITAILPYNENDLLIRTNDIKGLYIYNVYNLKILNTEVDEFLQNNTITKSCLLSNGNYAIGTTKGGLIIINKKGKLIYNINKYNGLLDDNITDIFQDRFNNLWVTLANGISRIETPSAFSFFTNSNIYGEISSIIRFDDLIYIATDHGVSYLSGTYKYNSLINDFTSSKFIPVSNISNCSLLLNFQNTLLALSFDGIYEIKQFEAKKILSGNFSCAYQSKYNKNLLYIGGENGLSVLEFENNNWKHTKLYNLIYNNILSLSEDDNRNLWAGSCTQKIYKVDFSNGFNNTKVIVFKTGKDGLPKNYNWINIINTTNGLLFSTSEGIYRFNDKTNKFYRDDLVNIKPNPENRWYYPIVEDYFGSLILSSGIKNNYNKTTAIAGFRGKGNKYMIISLPFKRIKDFTVKSIFVDKDYVVWLGGYDELIRVDSKKHKTDTGKYYALIRNIIIGKDSVVYYGNNLNRFGYQILFKPDSNTPRFLYKYNTIHFEFCSPYYKNNNEVLYQYYLNGFDKDWSSWTSENVKEYTNLPEGEYIFKVKSKNIYEVVSQVSEYKFIVLPPFYRTWVAYIIYLILLLSFVIMTVKWRSYIFAKEKHYLEKIISERTEELVKQKERAEELVANILPKDTAEELQSMGHVTRKKYKMSTVLFADIQGFTKIAEYMNPEFLLDELDKYIYEFDLVVEKFGIEKIKTIGDAYMCAGGIPKKNGTNPIDVVMAALEMQKFIIKLREKSQHEWDIRIGIHTGPVIAGVIGIKKMTYDIWGDTVNVASRMESYGEPGKINISEFTYKFVKDYFDLEYRGKIPVKHKGEVDMYFVKGYKKEFSINEEGLEPNELFFIKLQLLRFDDLEELIITKLDKGLQKNLYYHNLKHTIDVCVEVEILGRAENLTDEEILLLKTAALFHDSGFIYGFEEHELLSIKMVKDTLPSFGYSNKQIDIICDLIYATNQLSIPKNKLEQIICDADLSYLGRVDFIPVSQNLFRELFERGKVSTILEWNKKQVKFLEKHKYYTNTAIQMREENKLKHLEELKRVVY